MKVVINRRYGGFGLSHEAVMEYARRKGLTLYPFVYGRKPNGGLDFDNLIPYTGGESMIISYYLTPDRQEHSYFSVNSAIDRDDPDLVAVVAELGTCANGRSAALKIVTIPDDVDWYISEYDGLETIEEKHRSWA